MAPSLRVGVKIGPYFILALEGGTTTALGLGFVWTDFLAQRPHPYMWIHPSQYSLPGDPERVGMW